MADEAIGIEVAYAATDRQILIPLRMPEGTTVAQAIAASGILQEFPEIDLKQQKTGIFSQICELDRPVKAGDRVEIYRPLAQNPMDARRNRAKY